MIRRSQKRKKDSQVKQLFGLLGSVWVKAARKHADEIDPWQTSFYILWRRHTPPTKSSRTWLRSFFASNKKRKFTISKTDLEFPPGQIRCSSCRGFTILLNPFILRCYIIASRRGYLPFSWQARVNFHFNSIRDTFTSNTRSKNVHTTLLSHGLGTTVERKGKQFDRNVLTFSPCVEQRQATVFFILVSDQSCFLSNITSHSNSFATSTNISDITTDVFEGLS